MTIRRPRGAQPGNLNSTRHPWRTFWNRQALRAENVWVLGVTRDYEQGLIADKGGRENCSEAELRLIELAHTARVCMLLCFDRLPSGDLRPAIGEIPRFMTTELAALKAIGLGRRVQLAPAAQEYFAQRASDQEILEQASAQELIYPGEEGA